MSDILSTGHSSSQQFSVNAFFQRNEKRLSNQKMIEASFLYIVPIMERDGCILNKVHKLAKPSERFRKVIFSYILIF
jgi:hypothetical protein